MQRDECIIQWSQICKEYRQCKDPEERVQMLRRYASLIREEMISTKDCKIARTFVAFRQNGKNDDDYLIVQLQNIAYDAWHDALLQISTKDAFRILCNCITQNIEAAQRLLKLVQNEPTEPEKVLQAHTALTQHDAVIVDDAVPKVKTWNWVDLAISAHQSDRETLAAVIACWYNATILLHRKNVNMTGIGSTSSALKPSSLLLATLLRHAIPTVFVEQQEQSPDEATDWIRRAIALYSCMHGMRNSFTSLTTSSVVVPEHVVYLLLLRHTLEDETPPRTLEPLGSSLAEIQDSLQFLAQIVRRSIFDNRNDSVDETACALQRDVHHLALELINEALTDNGESSNKNRISVGTIDGFWEYIINELAMILDDWNVQSQGKSARDAPILSNDQQRFITNCVRCIGNLTYQCPYNQKYLRAIQLNNSRHGLHILLSTTGMAVSCFSVREWGIVAIRNALDNNPENQAIVERLQAEHAVQTTALDNMGLQINITKDGKATVTPKDIP